MAQGELFRQIVAFVNGSESSLAAVEHGVHLVRAAKGRLEAVIIADVSVPGFMACVDAEILGQLVAERSRVFLKAVEGFQRDITKIAQQAGIVATITKTQGEFVPTLIRHAEAASLITIGRSRNWQSGGLLGTRTEYVVRAVRKPVLIAPPSFVEPESIVVAYAGKRLGGLALRAGAGMSEALELPLHVLTVHDDPKERAGIQDLARDELGDRSGDTRFDAEDGEVAAVIAKRGTPETLLVMGSHGGSKFHRFLLGSVTERVMRRAEGPVVLTAKL